MRWRERVEGRTFREKTPDGPVYSYVGFEIILGSILDVSLELEMHLKSRSDSLWASWFSFGWLRNDLKTGAATNPKICVRRLADLQALRNTPLVLKGIVADVFGKGASLGRFEVEPRKLPAQFRFWFGLVACWSERCQFLARPVLVRRVYQPPRSVRFVRVCVINSRKATEILW